MTGIFVNKKQFASYKGVSYKTALKHYEVYREIAGKDDRQELTIHDISRIDDIPIEEVKRMF